MTTSEIIAALLPIFAKALPQLVKDIANLIHGNPKLQDETDEAYIIRLDALTAATADQIAAEDAEIQK